MLPHYEVLEVLGRGGMGAVYKGRQKSLKRLVAIKILPLGMADDEMKFAERFQNEAQTMAAMNHPAIVSVYDFGETADGLLYFIMEFVDGTDVHKMIQASGRLLPEQALAITAHVCDALAYAHKRGVVHRDIKPANILIDQEGHIKVADFGLAKMSDPAQTNGLTKTNLAMGTPDYVAPEVLVTGMVADHRADLYAVGVMLYQMLTGEVPRGMFKLPSQKGLGSDPRFDEIICKAMEQDRDERYQSAMDVRRALDEIKTTPLTKDDGTGIVSASQIPLKPEAKQPRPSGHMDTLVGSSQPPQRGDTSPSADQGARSYSATAPTKSSPATMWLSVSGIVAVLGVTGYLLVGGTPKTKSGAAVVGTSDASPKADAKPVDEAFFAKVAAAPAEHQAKLVVEKIEALNGGLVEPPTVTVTKGVVTGIELSRKGGSSLNFRNLSPIAALRGLTYLRLNGFNPDDLSFLRGLKIEKLAIFGGNFSGDFLRDLPLAEVTLRAGIPDYSILKGKPLWSLDLSSSQVRDITFVKGMPLTKLYIEHTAVTDLTPILELPLRQIVCDFVPERDAEILRSIPTLEAINAKPVAEFWASVGAKESPTSKASEAAIDLLKTDIWQAPWVLEQGVLKSTVRDGMTSLGTIRDGTIRVRLRDVDTPITSHAPALQLAVRFTQFATEKRGHYLLQIYPQTSTCNLAYLERNLTTGKEETETFWKNRPLPAASADGQALEFEFRAQGDTLSVSAAGQSVASIRDARLSNGTVNILANPTIEITRLETVGVTNSNLVAASNVPPPDVTNWQDVTATLREKVREIPGAVVEDGAVYFAKGHSSQRVILTPPGVSRFAMRVRYTGGTQVDRVKVGHGFDFFISQKAQVGFKRVTNGDVSDDLCPWTPHLAAYDSNMPHDLLVTMDGAQIRAWVDGHFMGEARDEVITEGEGGLMFLSYTTIHKVEIARLSLD